MMDKKVNFMLYEFYINDKKILLPRFGPETTVCH